MALAEWVSSQTEICANVIIYGQSPTTKRWYAFSTPCDLPDNWKSSLIKPDDDVSDNPIVCDDVFTFAKNTKTGTWYYFSQDCDAPKNWEKSTLPPPEGFIKQRDLTKACEKF